MPPPELSVVVPFRAHGERSLSNLRATLDALRAQTADRGRYEIVVVETAAEPEVGRPAGCRVVHVPYDRPHFCRSWALNVGARRSTGDALLFHEADVLAPPELVAEVLDAIARADLVRPARTVRDVDRSWSERLVLEGAPPPGELPASAYRVRVGPGASVAIRRTAFERIRGFNEQFLAWGGDDEEFLLRAEALAGPSRELGLVLLHLWHEQRRDPAQHAANRLLLARALSFAPDRLDAYVETLPADHGGAAPAPGAR